MLSSSCKPENQVQELTQSEEDLIYDEIKVEIEKGVEATRTKNIEQYMDQIPEDLVIHDEKGAKISRTALREMALRDWSIIDTTLYIKVEIDSIEYLRQDSLIVWTSQKWERLMFQRDGITKDTVLTTQKHREIWRKNSEGWFGYEVEELGGKVFINGNAYLSE